MVLVRRLGMRCLNFLMISLTQMITPLTTERWLFFFYLVNAPAAVQNKIVNHYTDGRHNGISPIFLSQSYYEVPQKLKLNCCI